MPSKQNEPRHKKEDISKNPDPKIDEDFKGYPHGSASDGIIHPKTKDQQDIAGVNRKDGEKRIISPGERKSLDEQESDGSASAFDEK